MNRLWVRLSLSFGVVVVLAAVLFIAMAMLITQTGFLRLLILNDLRSPGGLVDQLAAYYAEKQSWDDIESFMRERASAYEQLPDGFFVYLSDEREQRIFPPVPVPDSGSRDGVGDKWMHPPRRDTLPIMVDGQIRGYVNLIQMTPRANLRVIQGISTTLVSVGLVGGLLGLGAGILVSRSLTAPLNQLVDAARAFGAHNLQRRVKVSGTREIVQVADAFNDMADALQEAEMLRRNLVADVAHELRTPLTVMQGNLRAMLDDVYPLTKEELTRIYDQTRLLNRLVNDLHELTQAEANQLHLNLQPTDVNVLVEHAVSVFLPFAENEGIAVELCLPPRALLAQADPMRLTQVVTNLLSNALRHTPQGGAVWVTVQQADGQVDLVVRDNGEGIPAEHLPHVFERFYRVDRSRSRHSGGTGLGLAITRAIVNAHGGQITVASAGRGQGATFTVQIPAANGTG